MTLDELFEKYHEAWSAVARQTDGDRQSAGRAGVTAIVRALRDEIEDTYEREGCSWDGAHAYNRFNEILGVAGEGVAEMPDLPTRTVQLTGVTRSQRPDIQFEPATDAAPAFYAGQDPKISLNTDAAPVCDVCNGRGEILVRTMHDPDGPGDIDTCPECYVVPDAAPAVCVWEDGGMWMTTQCGRRFGYTASGLRVCPNCKAPIKFTEANHG